MAGPTDQERLRRLEAVTDSALARLEVEDLLVELLRRVRELLGADTAAVLMLDPARQLLVPVAEIGTEGESWPSVQVPVGKGFAGRIAAEGRPVVLDRVDPTSVLNPVLWQAGIRTMLGVPMLVSGTVTGVLHVGAVTTRRFDQHDIELLLTVADRIALATRAEVTRADRVAARALQRSLLPPELPALSGVELAARYLPGAAEVGGDWYDVFSLPSGRIGVVIGDVAGRGLAAAIVMGRLRSAIRAYSLVSEDPAEVLELLDRKAQHFEPAMMATVIYAVVDSSREQIQLSSAGHPPPVAATPDQDTRVLDLAGPDLPIGAQEGSDRHTTTVRLPPGGLLCLYTDGLIERRTRPLDAGIELLRASVTSGPAEYVCSTVLAELAAADPTSDDIALMVIRRSCVTSTD